MERTHSARVTPKRHIFLPFVYIHTRLHLLVVLITLVIN